MTVSTFYPDANTETTSVDGHVFHGTTDTWPNKRAAISGTAADAPAINEIVITAGTCPNYTYMYRVFSLFDTSSLGDSDTIDSATYEFVATARQDDFTESLVLVTTTPASNTALVDEDYDQVGTVHQATDVTLASLTVDSATYNALTLNATGRGNISKTGVSKFGLRLKSDADNVAPTCVNGASSYVNMASAEETLAGDKRPKLVVTHTAPPSTFVPKMLAF